MLFACVLVSLRAASVFLIMVLCEIIACLQSIDNGIESLQTPEHLMIPDLTEAFHLIVVIRVSFACKVDVSGVVCLFVKDLFG